MKILRAWDSGKNNVRVLVLNKETGNINTKDIPYKWHFFIKVSDYEREKSLINKQKIAGYITEIVPEEHYVRIYVDWEHNTESLNYNNEIDWNYNNWNLKKLKDIFEQFNIQTYEADLPLWRRWLIDQNIEIESDYKVAAIDLETDDSILKSKITPGEFRILSCAITDFETGKSKFLISENETDESEKELLKKIVREMRCYTCICAWNGDNFDFPYLKERMKLYGIEFDWRRVFCQDHLYIFKKIGPQLPSYSLEEVSQKFLGEGKVNHLEKIIELYRNDKSKLAKYNIKDTHLMYLLEAKTQLLATAREINIVGFCFVDDVYISRKIDTLVLKKSEELRYFRFKTKVKVEYTEEVDYEGAYVFKPVLGLHKNVIVFDFSSLYPSVIKTLNCSPDTILDEEELEKYPHTISSSNFKFRKDRIGILPSVVSLTAERRSYYKKLMKTVLPNSNEYKTFDRLQYVFKYFGLSFYGVVGMKSSRFYDKRIAESITLTGQFMTKTISAYFKYIRCNTLYGDTDSVFINNLDRKNINKVTENLNILCRKVAKEKLNSDSNFIEMAYDKDFLSLIIITKKRYAGLLYSLEGKVFDEPQFYAAGIEYKRTDSCLYVRELQKKILMRLLSGNESSLIDIKNLLYQCKMDCIQYKLSLDDIMFAQKLTKGIDEYCADLLHLKVAKEMMSKGKEVWIGDKIKYFILKTLNGKPFPAHIDDYKGKYDIIYYWNKKIYPAIRRVIEVVFKEEDWERFGIIKLPSKVQKNTIIGRSFKAWDV